MKRSDWKDISKCLDAGIPLHTWDADGSRREFVAGQITTDKRSGKTRTTHIGRSGGYIWLTRSGIARLADQAREKLARKDEILAEQAASRRSFLDQD